MQLRWFLAWGSVGLERHGEGAGDVKASWVDETQQLESPQGSLVNGKQIINNSKQIFKHTVKCRITHT